MKLGALGASHGQIEAPGNRDLMIVWNLFFWQWLHGRKLMNEVGHLCQLQNTLKHLVQLG